MFGNVGLCLLKQQNFNRATSFNYFTDLLSKFRLILIIVHDCLFSRASLKSNRKMYMKASFFQTFAVVSKYSYNEGIAMSLIEMPQFSKLFDIIQTQKSIVQQLSRSIFIEIC